MIWIFLPLALQILPRTLSNTRVSRGTAPLPLAFIELRAAGEAPFSAKEAPAVLRCVNAVGRAGRGQRRSWTRHGRALRAHAAARTFAGLCPLALPHSHILKRRA